MTTKFKIYLISLIVLLSFNLSYAATLVGDPQANTDGYKIRIKNSTPEPEDDLVFSFSAQSDGSLRANLVDFPAGENNIEVLAYNVWGKSTEVPFTFQKDLPGIPTNMALVNINGVVYIVTGPQSGITHYRIIIDGVDYVVEAETDGSLQYSLAGLENGIHSIELYALNTWGDSNPAPFGFTKTKPNAPSSLRLIP